MKADIKLQANLNVIYRIINALVKESIYQEGTVIRDDDHMLTISYQQHHLKVAYNYRSQFKRYVFTSVPVYQHDDESIQIDQLEAFILCLQTKFDIPFNERFIKELKHGRDAFELTYESFYNRKSLFTSTLKFSQLPMGINFFVYLQHMAHSTDFDPLTYSESLVFEGHTTHPLSKTKLPLTEDEIRAYAPEFEKVIPLKLMLIAKDKATETNIEGHESFILDQVLPEYKKPLETFLEPLQLELSDYHIVFVHPWQYEHVIIDAFSNWIKEKQLVPTPFTVDSKATLSFRTMDLIGKPYHVKLPVKVQATSAIRTVSTVTTVDGPHLSYQLQDMLDIYPNLKVAMEPYGLHADAEEDIAKSLGYIIRKRPDLGEAGITMVTAALVNENPIDEAVTVDSFIKWCEDALNKDTIANFIQTYAETLIPPLISYIQTYGIALEAHMQNTIVNLQQNGDMTFIVRDLGGSRIHLPTLQNRVPSIEITNTSLLSEDIEGVVHKFQHAVIQNQLGELIHHFSQYDDVNEQALFDIVRDVVEQSIDFDQQHAQALSDILFGDVITVKALMNMRMEGKVKKYITVDIANPIRKEVT
ncbi:IucA/IucC family protein [Staphylococcus massiliensis]|uniref:Siderophore synthetase n=1 Tax=Staphylococcus massiliensis S46 TaxID=1229783 RepID=K9AF09_9STAP|nr:IucA/IucC family protein [Staphylococcus massiliensis]EKU45843.1 hypothetical protein C273_10647 [Staphylococcus massiliensis S46]MCG3399328.1 IucA/IucC family siderophore biosynthesis protein [Staphylococcus massiliensis]MCG3413331.1 IucA/IucC family siderophore biosynthesis protein [Staphylococcus massiliensis]POA00668.1 IucA/IucC family siderophore biosynthesis protein [Staphylococcus massiliensis CCUG 55927]